MKSECKINSYGDKYWQLNDLLHREDGPAAEYANGDKFWWLNGLRHRSDGPACEFTNGIKLWYYNGKEIFCKDNEEFLRMIKMIVFL